MACVGPSLIGSREHGAFFIVDEIVRPTNGKEVPRHLQTPYAL